jgi:uncharacterized protein (TIGR03084 family)
MFEDVFEDLAQEQAALDAVLAALSDREWSSVSRAAPWTVADVVLHLAQTEEFAAAASAGQPPPWRGYGQNVDDAMDALVRSESGASPEQILARWRAACATSQAAMRKADPGRRLEWVASTVKPATLATTRLAEHWAHALDITEPLGLDYPDTARPAAHRLARPRHPAVRLPPGRSPSAPGVLRADRPGRQHLDLRRPRRRVLDHRAGGRILPGRRPAPPRRRLPA